MITIIPYEPQFEEGIKMLFAIPVSGGMVLSLEREPHYLAGSYIQTSNPDVYVCMKTESQEIIGVFNIGLRQISFQSKIVFAPYFCDLRIHPDYQTGFTLLKIIKFLDAQKHLWEGPPPLTVVFGDNYKMIDMINRRSRSKTAKLIPFYHEVANIDTHVFRSFKNSKGQFLIRKAHEADIPQMNQFQSEAMTSNFHAIYDFAELSSSPYYSSLNIQDYLLAFDGKNLVGFCGLWDTSGIKQTRILAYNGLIKWLRPLYNSIASTLFRFPRLPVEGSFLKNISIHSIVIKDRNPLIFKTLLREINQQYTFSKNQEFMCTLDQKDPLNVVLKTKLNKITKQGKVYLINKSAQLNESEIPNYFIVDAPRI